MQRHMCHACSSCLAWVRLTPCEQVDAAGAALFPLQTAAQGQEMSSEPRHLRRAALMSGFDILLSLRLSCTTSLMFDGRGCGLNLVAVGLRYSGSN